MTVQLNLVPILLSTKLRSILIIYSNFLLFDQQKKPPTDFNGGTKEDPKFEQPC